MRPCQAEETDKQACQGVWQEKGRGWPARRGIGGGSQRTLSYHRLPSFLGYLIIHVVQSLCGMAIMYGLVLPIVHNQGLEMLQGLGIGM